MQHELGSTLPVPVSPRLPRRLMTAGLAMTLVPLTITVAIGAGGIGTEPSVASVPLHMPAANPAQVVLNGPSDVVVVTQVYDAAQTSSWHAHAGINAVAVLSGELAIYGADCVRQSVVPGQPYVGGQELHLARNETDRAVEMIVTYLNPARPAPDRGQQPAPPNCAIS